MAAASAARHETRALLRAHLAAASRYGHLTRHCVVCHRLLRLSMDLPEPEGAQDDRGGQDGPEGRKRPEGRERPEGAVETVGDAVGTVGDATGSAGDTGGPVGERGGPAGSGGAEGPTDP
ncbi:DUF6274 family protein [Streptomyces sp. NPDC087908]|uniref:DUF6274 family protein n=1 Tax=Streptomyces sp. NPDC087908 TaxID=3365820 RepID=UPI00380C7231